MTTILYILYLVNALKAKESKNNYSEGILTLLSNRKEILNSLLRC